ncbi:MAG TPA: cytochrome b N-terminal domain-containing protein [Chloroflexota bacterium]|nr:cytochrome b N-terminal domain-containing protein [Chloroflexota bacterium]
MSDAVPAERHPHRNLYGWFQDRLNVELLWQALFIRKIPFGVNLLYTLGFVSLALFLVQTLTGTILALYYSPSPDHAYDSVEYTITQVPFGQVIRGIHHWGASAMVVVVVLHMLVTFGMGAYKYPREVSWWAGVALFGLTFAFGFTGYLLPWDEKAYWATTVGTNMAGTVPAVGNFVESLLRGGSQLGALTLTRFYAVHVLVLPMLVAGLIGLHLFLVVWQGVSVPPGLWDAALARLRGARRAPTAPETELEYRAVYDDFKLRGRRFFPDLIVEDAVVSTIVILIVIAFAVAFGTPLEGQADPTNTGYVPRPEWYFLFLFELLKYFPGSLEWVGVVVLPGLFFVFLFLLPLLDRGPRRSPRYRPISTAIAVISVTAVVVLTWRSVLTTPPALAENRGARLTSTEVVGRELVAAQGCVSCHVIEGRGGNVGPSLDGVALRRSAAYIHSYIENPRGLNPTAAMPTFIPPLTHEQVEDITQYLLALR